MAIHEDVDGLRSIKFLKLQGADSYFGTSATVAAYDATAAAAVAFSLSNWSACTAIGNVIDMSSASAYRVSTNAIAQIFKVLANLGFTVNYDGTNTL